MAETTQTFTIAVANEGERNMTLGDLREHEPKKITYGGQQVFFEHNGVFISMNRLEFKEVFNKY